MRNKFNRAPEFIEVYRNLSAHTNKSVEDASSFQLMRILVGVYQLNGANLTNIPSEAKVREVLQLSYQDRKIEVVLVNKTTSLAEASSEEVILGEFEINRGLILEPPYDNGQVIYGKSHYTYILYSYSLFWIMHYLVECVIQKRFCLLLHYFLHFFSLLCYLDNLPMNV